MTYAKINVGFAYHIGLQITYLCSWHNEKFFATNAIINSTAVVIRNYKREIEFSYSHKLVRIEK